MSHSAAPPLTPGAAALLAPWPGPCGGLPPFEHATPEALAQALPLAVEAKRRAVRSIADNPEPPAFDNTVAALEDSARSLRDLHAVFAAVSTTAQVGAMPEVAQRLAALVPALELEIAHDGALFSRIDAVWQTRESSGLDAQQIRLVEVLRARMVRAGAALGGADQARLQAIDARLATLSARFNQNLLAEQETQVVWLAAESDLDGLPPARREAAAAAARARGRAGAWAIRACAAAGQPQPRALGAGRPDGRHAGDGAGHADAGLGRGARGHTAADRRLSGHCRCRRRRLRPRALGSAALRREAAPAALRGGR